MEKFSLKWNDFQPNVTKSFKRLRYEEDYSDVTLIGDDYQPLRAHKVVLSSCSEYFKNILFNSRKFSNPVLCMEGLTKGDLTNVLDYVYNGEIQILQDGLDRFMTIAERLKLEGLNGQESGDQVDQTAETTEERYHRGLCEVSVQREGVNPSSMEGVNDLRDHISVESLLKKALNSKNNQHKDPNVNPKMQLKTEVRENEIFFIESQNISGQEVNKKLDELYTTEFDSHNLVMYHCNFCSKNSKKKGHMREHVEIHVEGLQFRCNSCDKSYKTRNTLRSHTREHVKARSHNANKSHNDREEGFSDHE